jgi:MFS family permease
MFQAMDSRLVIERPREWGLYHGWFVVAAAFLVALFGFGLGFYGPGIYLVALKARHDWSIGELSSVITTYYVLGAGLLFLGVGSLFQSYGPRKVLIVGIVAMGVGLVLLTWVARLWQVYAAFALMSVGWATMSGAAINILVAPWFERRRGLAVSWALNGASAGGVIIAPALTFLTTRYGFGLAIDALAGSMLAILMPVVILVLRSRRPDECDPPDRDIAKALVSPSRLEAERFRLASVLCGARFISISVPFALGLTAQVAFFTHQMAFLSPTIGTVAAGWAISLTTFAAVVGRIVVGFIVDQFDRRIITALNFIVQMVGMAVLAISTTPTLLYLGCAFFGIGSGNLTSLPGLLVQQEFAKQHFARIVSLVVAINQFSFAFGPTLLGQLEAAEGSYRLGLLLCLFIEGVAAIIVIAPVALGGRQQKGMQAI